MRGCFFTALVFFLFKASLAGAAPLGIEIGKTTCKEIESDPSIGFKEGKANEIIGEKLKNNKWVSYGFVEFSEKPKRLKKPADCASGPLGDHYVVSLTLSLNLSNYDKASLFKKLENKYGKLVNEEEMWEALEEQLPFQDRESWKRSALTMVRGEDAKFYDSNVLVRFDPDMDELKYDYRPDYNNERPTSDSL